LQKLAKSQKFSPYCEQGVMVKANYGFGRMYLIPKPTRPKAHHNIAPASKPKGLPMDSGGWQKFPGLKMGMHTS